MTVKEMFENKYRDKMATMTEREWKRIKEDSENLKIHPAKYIMLSLEITENECNPRQNAETYWELIKMNKNGLVASNRHRQYHGKVNTFWLTKKGYKKIFEQ